eukprot:SAG31_NODE_33990_length_338_cov_0.615063_1_plen_67_part_10
MPPDPTVPPPGPTAVPEHQTVTEADCSAAEPGQLAEAPAEAGPQIDTDTGTKGEAPVMEEAREPEAV